MSKDAGTPPTAAAASGGLNLPSTNRELKREENEALFGQDLILAMRLPSGERIEMKVKESNEVGYVKLLLAEKCGLKASNLKLLFDGRPLIDPMSLCDHPGVSPPGIEIDVEVV